VKHYFSTKYSNEKVKVSLAIGGANFLFVFDRSDELLRIKDHKRGLSIDI
jgi:hypothetical protein